ncbi:hypothetical protein HO173_008475 [Letharia columbiana]|uniref:Uncharacterized protein n=1 Tax=Letharia columbiana TaxID=112416 RepID=A0A8H6L2Q1_9LECA|nr:uncharacterized protein HO173_008475 [Letharia columbiana]KAF6233351.1 hypothetical protein HO173_008475 [Letharia columbiana]
MTSAGRISLAARLALPQSSYVCLHCRLRASTAIWGSETPPGQDDPYGKESVSDQRRREKEQAREKGRELEPAPEQEVEQPEDEDEYFEADTAEGLEMVGGPGWGTRQWEVANPFKGFSQLYCKHCNVY